MRRIKCPASFRHDYKREAKGRHRSTLNNDLLTIFDALVADRLLNPCYRDHALTGERRATANVVLNLIFC